MRRIAVTVALALSVLGCYGPAGAKGDPVTLVTVQTDDPCCLLAYQVVDVIADSTVGTAIKGSGEPLRWPTGYTGSRVGAEIEVRDPAGKVVMTTGNRYWISPSKIIPSSDDSPEWVIGEVRPCPDCTLGGGPL